jgi:hypothetical protein
MMKLFVAIFFIWSSVFALDDALDNAVKSIMGAKSYSANKQLVGVVFRQKDSFYDGVNVNYLSVIKVLKENKLVDFSQKNTQNFNLSFSSDGGQLLFVKIVTDSLRDVDIFKYMIKESHLNSLEFEWSIELSPESSLDPVSFGNQLSKYGCKIAKLNRNDNGNWEYKIDMRNARLNVPMLSASNSIKTEHTESEKWIDVSQANTINISSNHANNWFPSISFYDQNLGLIKVQKIDEKTSQLDVSVPSNAIYMKVTDIYTLKNIKNGLSFEVNTPR